MTLLSKNLIKEVTAVPSADVPIHSAVPPRRVDREGFWIREDVLYTNAKGRDKQKLHKRAKATFELLGEVLRRVLERDETIFYIAVTQAMPGALAQFAHLVGGGWHSYSLPRALLIFTERRIIALRERKHFSKWVWDRGIRVARWGDVQDTKSAGFIANRLTVKFRDGGRQQYWKFASGDLQKVTMLITALKANASGEVATAGRMIALCPRCLTTLSPGNYQCPSCGFRFKDEKTLLQRGILIPGGASLYVGATGVGVLRSVFEMLVTLSILGSIYRLTHQAGSSAVMAPLMMGLYMEILVLAIDKAMAIAFSRPQIRDFLPAE